MTRTGTCKDTSHPEKNYCILRCFSPCTSKTGMSITIMLSISELLLMYLFWGIFETPDINLCETLHREILLPGSGGKKQERHTTMCCSRNLALMSSKFALRLTPALVSCLRSLPSASEYTLPSQSASSLQKHSQVTALVQSTTGMETTTHAWHWGPIFKSPIRQKSLQKELQVGAVTDRQKEH